MGFWDKHPMAGDPPLDAKYMLDAILFTQEEIEEEMYENEKLYAERLQQNLHEAIGLNYETPMDGDMSFILPFTIANLGVQIDDKEKSELVKAMIGDGGASNRKYPPLMVIDENYKNTYNNFQSPLDHANQLRDMWDDLMEGKRSFDELGHSPSLLETIVSNLGNGPLNTK